MYFLQHNCAPLELRLTTYPADDAAYGTLVVPLGQPRTGPMEIDMGDGAGPLLINYTSTFRAFQLPSREVLVNTIPVLRYALGSTGNLPVVLRWQHPERVKTLTSAGSPDMPRYARLWVQGLLDARLFPALENLLFDNNRLTGIGLPLPLRVLRLFSAYFLAQLPEALGPSLYCFDNLPGQGYLAGTLGCYTLGAGAAPGRFDLREQPLLTSVWAGKCGLRQLLFAPDDNLEELVVQGNALRKTTQYGSPWNRLPLSLRLLSIQKQRPPAGLTVVSTPAPDLSQHDQLRYAYLGNAGLAGELVLSASNVLEDLRVDDSALTSLRLADIPPDEDLDNYQRVLPAALRYLVTGPDGVGTGVRGQAGAGLPICDLTGLYNLRTCIWTDCNTQTLYLPDVPGLRDLRVFANRLDRWEWRNQSQGMQTNFPPTLERLETGSGNHVLRTYYPGAQHVYAPEFYSAGQQTLPVEDRLTLQVGSCAALAYLDCRRSNISYVQTPQGIDANGAPAPSPLRVYFAGAPGTYAVGTGYQSASSNNNGLVSVDLSQATQLTHLVLNYCEITTASGSIEFPLVGRDRNTTLVQLEIGGNQFDYCPLNCNNYTALVSLNVSGHPAGGTRWSGEPGGASGLYARQELVNLAVLAEHHQDFFGLLDLTSHSKLVEYYGQHNAFCNNTNNPNPTILPATLRVFVFNDQVNLSGSAIEYGNVLDFGAVNGAMQHLLADRALVFGCRLPPLGLSANGYLTLSGNGQLTDRSLYVPPSFVLPSSSTLDLSDCVLSYLSDTYYTDTSDGQPGGGLLAAFQAGRIRSKSIDLTNSSLAAADLDALIEAIWANRLLFAPSGKILRMGGIKNESPAGVFAAPAGYTPLLTEVEINTLAPGWTPRAKLWVLQNRYGWVTVTFKP